MIPVKFLFLIVLVIGLTSACQTLSGIFNKSGTMLTIEVKPDEPNSEQTTDLAARTLENRLNALGVSGKVSKTAPNRLEAKIYGAKDLQRIKQILLATSKFELRKVVTPPSPAPLQTFPTEQAALQSLGETLPANRKILPYAERDESISTNQNSPNQSKQWVIVENPPVIDGNEVRDASAYSATGNYSDYVVTFALKPGGAQKFGDWTARNINNYLAIVLNDEVKSSAYIKSQIFDAGEITGNFTRAAAEDLALIMRSGYLPATLTLIEEKSFEDK